MYKIQIDGESREFKTFEEAKVFAEAIFQTSNIIVSITSSSHSILKRSVAIEAIDNLKEAVKDWKRYRADNIFGNDDPILGIINDCETVISALEGETITIVKDGESTNGH